MRRTMLYLPGNNPNMLVRGHLFGSDGIIMDLEDAVAMSEKDAARTMVSKFLRRGDFGSTEVTVRINGVDTEYWKKDLEAVVPYKRLDGIRLPKADSPQIIKDVDEELSRLEDKYGIEQGHIKLFCILETAYGIWHAYDVAKASKRVAAILPGQFSEIRKSYESGGAENLDIRLSTLSIDGRDEAEVIAHYSAGGALYTTVEAVLFCDGCLAHLSVTVMGDAEAEAEELLSSFFWLNEPAKGG